MLVFLNNNKLSINDMFRIVANKTITKDAIITEQQFDNSCAEHGYEPKDRGNLLQVLMDKSSRGITGISLYRLQQYKKQFDMTHKKPIN